MNNRKNDAKTFANDKGDAAVAAVCERIIGYEEQNRFEKAAELLKVYWTGFSGDVHIDALSDHDKALILLRIGTVCSGLGSSKQVENSQLEALDLLREAEKISVELGDGDLTSAIKSKIGYTYWRTGKLDEAQKYLQQAIAGTNNPKVIAVAYCNLGIVFSTKHEHYSALQAATTAIDTINSSGLNSHFVSAISYSEHGLACKNIGKTLKAGQREQFFDKAILSMDQALFYFEKANHAGGIVSTRNNLGYLFYSLGDYEKALSYLDKAYRMALRIEERRLIADVADTLARSYLKLGQNERAVEFATIAVELVRNFEHALQLSDALRVQAIAYVRNNQREEATNTFSEARSVANSVGNGVYSAQATLFYLDECYNDLNPAYRQKMLFEVCSTLLGTQDEEILGALRSLFRKLPVDNSDRRVPLPEALKSYEAVLIAQAIDEAEGNQQATAKILGISRQRMMAKVRSQHPQLLPLISVRSKTRQPELKENGFRVGSDLVSKPRYIKVRLTEQFYDAAAGDFIVVETRSKVVDAPVVFYFSGTSNLRIGLYRKVKENEFVETVDGIYYVLNDVDLIGTAIGHSSDEYLEVAGIKSFVV